MPKCMNRLIVCSYIVQWLLDMIKTFLNKNLLSIEAYFTGECLIPSPWNILCLVPFHFFMSQLKSFCPWEIMSFPGKQSRSPIFILLWYLWLFFTTHIHFHIFNSFKLHIYGTDSSISAFVHSYVRNIKTEVWLIFVYWTFIPILLSVIISVYSFGYSMSSAQNNCFACPFQFLHFVVILILMVRTFSLECWID